MAVFRNPSLTETLKQLETTIIKFYEQFRSNNCTLIAGKSIDAHGMLTTQQKRHCKCNDEVISIIYTLINNTLNILEISSARGC